MKKKLKFFAAIALCMSFLFMGMSPVSAFNQGNVITYTLKDGTKITKEIRPRSVETFTITRDDAIRNYGSVRWKVTLSYNPTSRIYTFVKIAYENHFNSSVPTYRVANYSVNPGVGSDVTNVNILFIKYEIHTIGSNNISWSFNFDI